MTTAAAQPNNDLLETSSHWTFITDFGSDINLLTHAQGQGGPARAIQIISAGSGGLVVVKANNATETLSSLTAGMMICGHFQQITASGTNVVKAIVYW